MTALSKRYLVCLVAILFLTVVVRVGYMLLVPDRPVATDGVTYRKIALNLISGHGFSIRPDNPTAWREPGYPMFLGAVYLLLGRDAWAVGLAQAVFQIAAVAGVWWMTFRMYGPNVALVAALLTALSPSLIKVTADPISESVYASLLVLAVTTLLWASEAPTPRRLILAGLALGAAALVRELTLAIGLMLLGAWWLSARRSTPRVLAHAGVVGAVMFLVVLPWLVRNYVTFGQVLPLHVHGGAGIYLAYHPQFDFYAPWPKDGPNPYTFVSHLDTNDGVQGIIFERLVARAAIKNIVENPLFALRSALVHLAFTWSPMPETVEAALGSLPLYYVLKLYSILVLVLAAVGAFASAQTTSWRWVLVVAAIAHPTIAGLHSGGIHRYVIPAMPFLLLLASSGLLVVWRRLRAGQTASVAAAGVERPNA